jgi:bifunctional UDP-N-acetylglucosamine pyrophosphorylase/glucosamine-1-phosphate N-acetyltransferase
MKFKSLILAAGKGTRMKSQLPKVVFKVAGKEMINYVIENVEPLNPEENIVVIGSGAETVKNAIKNKNVIFAIQKEQKGTADAVKSAMEYYKNYDGKILILCGDMPLVSTKVLKEFLYKAKDYDTSFISVETNNPKGYGRVIRDINNNVIKIVEEKDANETEKKVKEINTGIYLVNAKTLINKLSKIDNKNAQGEYYLTDIVSDGTFAYKAENFEEFLGINDKMALCKASKIIWKQRVVKHMQNGVTFMDYDNVYIDENVTIDKDTIIYPNVHLQGKTSIGENCIIFPGVRIVNTKIENNCEIKDNTLIVDSFVGEKSTVGPMAQLRPGTILKGHNKIGNFVETKKAIIGKGTKASHLTYLGDAEIGEDVNIGCGTITCNYDGINKHKTTIGNRVFVGSDVQFVAPVTIGDDALLAAGSTITKDVPENSLGITRAEQKNIENWVLKWKAKQKKK